MPNNDSIIISGLWVRTNKESKRLEVLVEVPQVDGNRGWRLCYSEPFMEGGGVVSEVIGPEGIRKRSVEL